MAHHDYRRPTLPGAVPQETYERTATPVFLVNQDGSARRRDDTDDTGAQQRRAQGQDANGGDHFWRCWGDQRGPGAQFRTEVLGKLDALTKRSWYQAGGAAVVGLIAMAFLASWLSGKFAATERNSVKREDVVAAVQKSADMAVAKQADDFTLLKKQLEQASADTAPLPVPMTTKARR
jgi:hypothetical protein